LATTEDFPFRFGTAGVPQCAKGGSLADGVRAVAGLGLQHMEIEWVHGVRTRPVAAEEVRRACEETGVSVSCHAPYYVNLASLDPEITNRSIQRIDRAARTLALCGGDGVVFHPAFVQGRPREVVARLVSEALSGVLEGLDRDGVNVTLRPETTGKPTQFGSLDEVLSLCRDLPNTSPCIDFPHLHARHGGGRNDEEWFGEVLDRLVETLGADSARTMHVHLSGIEHTPKGERKHYNVEEEGNSFNWRGALNVLKRRGAAGTVVCESPNLETDARLFLDTYSHSEKE
jgi:deoxyribonuclease-4